MIIENKLRNLKGIFLNVGSNFTAMLQSCLSLSAVEKIFQVCLDFVLLYQIYPLWKIGMFQMEPIFIYV